MMGSAGLLLSTPDSNSQRKKDLIDVMRLESVLGLQGTSRSFSIQYKWFSRSAVVNLPDLFVGGQVAFKQIEIRAKGF